MEKDNVKEYVCQYWHEFWFDPDVDGVWIYEKTVSTKKEALAWVEEIPEARRFYEVEISNLSVMKEQLKCIKNNIQSDLPKDILISTYNEIIKNLENNWRMPSYNKDGDITNLPEMHKPLLLLIRKKSGKSVYKAEIYDDWTKNLFYNNNVIAWKYIQVPSWISNGDFSKAYPKDIILDGHEPSCDIEITDEPK